MANDKRAQKNVFKQIFIDGWEAFKQAHPRYESVDEVVQKMLGCGDPNNGYSPYVCPDCHEQHIVAFSCKSTFCLSCANVYGQDWAETVKGMLHPGVSYRHLILTVPEGLRTLIYQQAAVLLDGLIKAAQGAMDETLKVAKKEVVRQGYIVVLQTAGRSARYNPHLHVLMTDGGLTETGQWRALGYVPYAVLHRQWQQHVLSMIESRLAGNIQAQALVATLRRMYPKGFVAHVQGDSVPRLSQLTRYLVKYVVSPPIALSRIIAYDREQAAVTYWYRDHLSHGKKKTATVSRETFIGRMVQHILPKGFQRIRYYGLQATCILVKVRQRIVAALQGAAQMVITGLEQVKRLTYRQRLQQTLGRDPLQCPRCGAQMWLWVIWHPDYGLLYDELTRMQQGVYAHDPGSPQSDRSRQPEFRTDNCTQLPLFAV